MSILTNPSLDVEELRAKVQRMYTDVAQNPGGDFHFETGRVLAERLGYDPELLDRVPAESIESFAGVGAYFQLAGLREGETVVDLGSGAGMDSFIAARLVGPTGRVIGIDMTDAQLEKAEQLAARDGFSNVSFRHGYLEHLPVPAGSADAVISNGVINLCPDKAAVFEEVARVLAPGGRLALSDIVTEKRLPENVTCDATLWAACIGGAAQQDDYRKSVEAAGLRVLSVEDNSEYNFLSRSAQGATRNYGVKSISLIATKT